MGQELSQTTPKAENKVTFGLENVHWSKPEVGTSGAITYSKP